MKIGLYVDYSNMKAGGIFTYSVGVLKLLISMNEVEEIYLIYPRDQEEGLKPFLSESKINPVAVDRKRFSFKYLSILSFFFHTTFYVYQTYFQKYFPNFKRLHLLRNFAVRLNPYRRVIDSLKIDLLHVPFKVSPVYGISTPVITTMHDVQEMHFPEFFTSQERIDRSITYKIAADESDHIVVSFDHVKNDIVKYFHVPPEKVSVCRLPLSDSWFVNDKFTPIEELIKKYGIEKDFILYPAATWQHKNHMTLLKAAALLKKQNTHIFLVCTGNKNEFYKKIEEEIENLDLSNSVKFLGVVPEEDLIGLYKSTLLTVIPTLYEAGSGPLFEAMRYGSPVICSNVTSLPETIGNDNYVFNPLNPQEMSRLIYSGLTDDSWRSSNSLQLSDRLHYFVNRDVSSDFIDVYKRLIEIQ